MEQNTHIDIQEINPTNFEYQNYSNEDTSLISSYEQDFIFNSQTNYIEYFIYDLNNIILFQNYNYINYKILNNKLSYNPSEDIIKFGYNEGNYNVLYNFLNPLLSSSPQQKYYISEISSNRTELRLSSLSIPLEKIISSSIDLQNKINSNNNIYDFYLNFGNNKLVLANNILLDNNSVLIKLYQPLPEDFELKNELWVVETISEPKAYNIQLTQTFFIEPDITHLRGPNININVKDQINNSTDYTNISNLFSNNNSQGSGSFQYQLNSLLNEKGLEINIDYSDYSNFIHFSSAKTRLENFYYKLLLLEEYTYSASLSNSTTDNYYVSSSNNIYQLKINDIITNFDGYEYYLYFESGSTCWPKTNQNPPYINYTINSTSGSNWFVSQSQVAEDFDNLNSDYLYNSIPSYISDDQNNSQYILFIDMIGQHFDNIFVYFKDITNKYDADNRLNYGVSKDLIADVLKDLGIKIYQNNFSSNDLYSALIGFTSLGNLYNLPFTTGSLPTPAGWEYINTYITSSDTSSLIPVSDINKETYKRIFHNLPLLLKKKGSTDGLKLLINLYGIPDTILRVSEFGGKDKNISSYDQWQEEFNYSTISTGNSSDSINIPFKALSGPFGSSVPKSMELRFKPATLPTSSIPYSQSILTFGANSLLIALEYTGSGYISESYSGSIVDPYYQYANLKFFFTGISDSASIYLPFFNGDWWNILINAEPTGSNYKYTLFAKNTPKSPYNSAIFESSSSIVGANFWNVISTGHIFLNSSSLFNSINYLPFTGSYQEFRYYNIPLSKSVFDSFSMNPNSIEGNTLTGTQSGINSLSFRLSLGGELFLNSSSIHPSITGSSPVTNSFNSSPQTASFRGTREFEPNKEYYFINQLPSGIKNIISNKIESSEILLPYSSSLNNIPNSDVLSPFISIQQNYPISNSYTPNNNYLEIALSPQNEINEDINNQLGYFNLGDYIGDPRQFSQSLQSYPDLNRLRNNYFKKYTHNYKIWDYIRLIKYFDNSLFKMLIDWISVKTSLSSGIVIKQHLLERNRYPQINPIINTSIANIENASINIPFITQNILITGSSIQIETITGSNGGSIPEPNSYNQITQSWSGENLTISGSVPFIHNTEEEFFNGELSGSVITASKQNITLIKNYEVLINNVSESRLSSNLFDVDYSQGGILPVNQQLLIDLQASKARIPDSNYTSKRIINPRYNGSKLEGLEYNEYNEGDISYGKTPIITTGCPYGLYFDDGRAHEPELPNKTIFQILYMFDEDGNTINPDLTGSYYNNIQYAFGKDSQVLITLREPALVNTNVVNNFQGIKNVYWPQYQFLSPLTTQSGSSWSTSSIYLAINEQPIDAVPLAVSTGYWFTGSSSKTVLTASIGLAYYFISNILYPNLSYIQTKGPQNEWITGSRVGFGGYPENILPIKVNQYDIIRFNTGYFDYSQDYLILSSSYVNNPGSEEFYLFVDRDVTGSIDLVNTGSLIDLNQFTILNKISNQQKLFVDVYKTPGLDTGRGFILPAYPSEKLKSNFSNIVAKLSSENLL